MVIGGRVPSNQSNVVLIVACVVMAVLVCSGVLVALLVPAVQQAREAARRTQCKNNLKSIGWALHNYHDAWQSFPPAYTVDAQGRPLHSWRVLILPFLDQAPLYKMKPDDLSLSSFTGGGSGGGFSSKHYITSASTF